MKTVITTILTAFILTTNAQSNNIDEQKKKSDESLILIDVQNEIANIKARNYQAGNYLITAKNQKMQAIGWFSYCALIGSTSMLVAKGKTGGVVFGSIAFAVGTTVSVVKVFNAFKNIEKAGRALIK